MTADGRLLSCVVVTGDRPHFLAQALRCFARRTYRPAELIVVDSGREAIDHLCSGLPDVRYVRTSPETELGDRLNLGFREARGDLFQKIDDDDYYHPSFLERAVGTLLASEAGDVIVAWDCFHILLRGEPRLRFSGHGWAAGGTLCFPRSVWERTPFRGGGACDHFLMEDSGASLKRVCAPELYVIVRHGGNMWSDLRGNDVDSYFRSLPPADRSAVDLVDPADEAFYAGLCRTSG